MNAPTTGQEEFAKSLPPVEVDKCSECETQLDVPDDAATVASSVDCRRRSRLAHFEDPKPNERRSVTFQLPEQDVSEEEDEQSCGRYVDDCTAERAQPRRDREHAARPRGLVRTHEKIFIVPGVDCLGCLLGHGTLKPVVNALRRNAAFLEEPALLATAHAAYEEIRTKCRLEGGLLAPEWSTQGIRLHFWQHALDPVLEAVRLARRFDEVQSVLMEEVDRCTAGEGGGPIPIPPSTLGLLQRVSAAQAKQHAWLQKLLASCESNQQQQQDRHRVPVPVSAPPARTKRDRGRGVRRFSAVLPQARVVPRPSAVATAIPPPSAPAMPPPCVPPALASSPPVAWRSITPATPPVAAPPRATPPPPPVTPPPAMLPRPPDTPPAAAPPPITPPAVPPPPPVTPPAAAPPPVTPPVTPRDADADARRRSTTHKLVKANPIC